MQPAAYLLVPYMPLAALVKSSRSEIRATGQATTFCAAYGSSSQLQGALDSFDRTVFCADCQIAAACLTPHPGGRLTIASMRFLLVLASAAALAPLVAKRDASSVSRRVFGVAAASVIALPANAKIDVNNAMAREFSAYPCVEINQCVGCNDAAVLAPSSGEEPASPRHRAGVASMAWRSTRRFSENAP